MENEECKLPTLVVARTVRESAKERPSLAGDVCCLFIVKSGAVYGTLRHDL
jgi:hypothetical protein